ncbi:conserved hypothetical protein (plasmid) [Rhizorhabdus wittichii RW1]|uniref:DNA 3'-5' helicase II n=1 Tax=Rhizorhabdus wittichii (strain DSM 6014 / CCUG 31198 / JCM 15750 / NBRC 105917 / EY 4224 / RW1) TaxID=392499 RepID=A0A9J9LF22_RHIWR|nr:NERD domain-containing protein [Rhizorhabdus sp.]ABQ71372.1 conserved hypothetical protein [Rhizorhabdus wittichii RW1]MBD3762314.1 NERD domain-containing protein [Rhizorhabdus sp.]
MRRNRIISPPREDLDRLRQPLTPGERVVLEFFDAHLDPEWEIYCQPHLNGLRPDFVLLNPWVGIAVFEVKDWNLDAMHYFVPAGGRDLHGRKDGKSFSLAAQNPVTKVNHYRDAVYKLYCPRLKQNAGFAAVTAGVIFPFADSRRVRDLFAGFLTRDENDPLARYQPVSGRVELAAGRMDLIMPESQRQHSMLMREDIAADLRGWLVEPDFSVTQRRPLEMDANQRQLAETRTESGYRRIKGPAGSGKSLVLAARAARLADEGKSVLVATFNITLWHYLRDLVVRALKVRGGHRNVVFVNFHSWCKQVCMEVGWSEAYDELWKSGDGASVMEAALPSLVASAAAEEDSPRYDAILVDEGQDYRPLWWDTLRRFLKPGGEMILAADATQDVYGTAQAWTNEAMAGAGFRGAWAQLDVSYRLPPATLPLIQSFVTSFLPEEGVELPSPPQASLDLFPVSLRWVQCTSQHRIETCVTEIVGMMRRTGKALANADITFLAADASVGAMVVSALADRDIASVATFAPDMQERRREKMAFYMGDARVKATTLHSFKGWESPLLVIYVDENAGERSLALVYAGLTRLKRQQAGSAMTVICSSALLRDYGSTWPDFIEKGPLATL